MPNDFLLARGGRSGMWIKLHNTDTGIDYFSGAQTDQNGMYVHSAPPDHYVVYVSKSASLPAAGDASWESTGDVDFVVPYTAGDAVVGSSFTAKSSGPNTPDSSLVNYPGGSVFEGVVQLKIGDGSNLSGAAAYFQGENGAWGVGIDQAALVPFRDWVPAYRFLNNRTVADGVVVLGQNTFGSATAAFVAGDIGRWVRTQGLPTWTRITSIDSGTQARLSANATRSGSGQYAELGATGDLVEDLLYLTSHGAQNATLSLGGSATDSTYRVVVQGAPDGVLDTAMGGLRINNGLNSTGDVLHAERYDRLALFTVSAAGVGYIPSLTVGENRGPNGAFEVALAAAHTQFTITADAGYIAFQRFISGAQYFDLRVQDTNVGGTLWFMPAAAAANQVGINQAGVFLPVQHVTAGGPAYVKGGVYFDTTLNKLRIGGATVWETVTSA